MQLSDRFHTLGVSLFYVTGVVCIELFSVDLFAHSATFFEWFHISIEFFCGCNSILVSSIAASITGIQVHRTGYFGPFSLISVQIVCQTLEQLAFSPSSPSSVKRPFQQKPTPKNIAYILLSFRSNSTYATKRKLIACTFSNK